MHALIHALLHQAAIIFGYPYGIVIGNLLAEVIVVAWAIALKERLGRKYAAFHHRHMQAHLARLENEAGNGDHE